MRYVALLRGVNVGGKNVLPMATLARLVREAGCENVTTYIQSGNVVFAARAAVARALPAALEAAIFDAHGIRTPVVLRSTPQIAATLAGNPFLAAPDDAKLLHVMFLVSVPAADRVAALDPNRSPPDAFAVRGADVYLRLPNGGGNTKLTTAYFDAKLATTGTVRNWNTVRKLGALLGVSAASDYGAPGTTAGVAIAVASGSGGASSMRGGRKVDGGNDGGN